MNDAKEILDFEGMVCPVPMRHISRIVLGHGSGGRLSRDLIESLFIPPFDNPILRTGDDAGVIKLSDGLILAVSTDAHVVSPLDFPGGDIGRLAVCGTVNDISMMGAVPLFLTASFILEEGLEISRLDRIVNSMRMAADEAGVQIIAGDTKVVEKGKVDEIFISTSGIGEIPNNLNINGRNARTGDVLIISGTIGDHGIAVLSARGELGFEANIQSDVAPLNKLVAEMIQAGGSDDGGSSGIHVLRDPTRGGLATTLNEIAIQSGISIIIHEDAVPIHPSVRAACEILGFDPLYIANEGKLIAILSRDCANDVITCMRANTFGKNAAIIGEIQKAPPGKVLMKTPIGTTRVVDMLSGELLPRIC
jgi:hydrogenase expression/formation protein HypE